MKDTDGLDQTMLVAVRGALALHPSINAVYSAGGGNVATLKAFDEIGVTPTVFVAHDLDGDNRALLRTRTDLRGPASRPEGRHAPCLPACCCRRAGSCRAGR